jgi:hypothetical protein
MRCLEIISEASRRLSEDLKLRHPSIGWKNMARAGNIYRNDYEDVAAKLVWDTVTGSLAAIAGCRRRRDGDPVTVTRRLLQDLLVAWRAVLLYRNSGRFVRTSRPDERL